MAYYDKIAGKWHSTTGYRGGALKDLVLNNLIIDKVPSVAGRSILEVGAGNGYFLPLLLSRFSGQVPAKIVVSDASGALLKIAQRSFHLKGAEYRIIDLRRPMPFDDGSFDLVLSIMVFNEIPDRPLKCALSECRRVMSDDGLLLVASLHPDFVNSLARRKLLRPRENGALTMPGSGDLRLPVVQRSLRRYEDLLEGSGLQFTSEAVYATEEVLHAKPALRQIGKVPLACVFTCSRVRTAWLRNRSGLGRSRATPAAPSRNRRPPGVSQS